MLREPAKYVNFIELILEEINDRLINKPLEISEWQNALICKALTSKPILLDATKPQVSYFMQIQIYRLSQQLGKQI